MEKANVFNIERGSSEDGPGIRTVVFLKGCSLRCRWCANPESQSMRPEILYIANVCVHCGACEEICPTHSISLRDGFGYISDADSCTLCGACIDRCYADARRLQGREYTSQELADELLKDAQYFRKSGGGVTFSGGEPLLHAEFLCETTALLKRESISCLVETCGFAPQENLRRVADCVDAFFYDFKHADSEIHRQLTGQSNELILKNLEWLEQNFTGSLSIRYPYIPGCNDSKEAVCAFFEYIRSFQNVKEIVFLPYHRLGLPKYVGLGRIYAMGDMKSLKREALNPILDWAEAYGLSVKIQ